MTGEQKSLIRELKQIEASAANDRMRAVVWRAWQEIEFLIKECERLTATKH